MVGLVADRYNRAILKVYRRSSPLTVGVLHYPRTRTPRINDGRVDACLKALSERVVLLRNVQNEGTLAMVRN